MTSGGDETRAGIDTRRAQESAAIVAALARALDDTPEGLPPEEFLQIGSEAEFELADRLAGQGDFSGARQVMLREARTYTLWSRAMDFGVVAAAPRQDTGADADAEQISLALRSNLAKAALRAAINGGQAGLAPEQTASEVVAAEAFKLHSAGRFITADELARCYIALRRPELGLTILLRCSPAGFEATHLRSVLIAGRCIYAMGQVQLLAELMTYDWECDTTGLQKELLARLVTAEEPSEKALAARGAARHEAMAKSDWAALRELALFDVMWLEETEGLWMALSAFLKMNNAPEQAALAEQAARLVGDERSRR
jgi:hypothetical protein